MASVGIVIVNYNGEKYQNDCIASLYDMTYRDFEIIIVDSGSKDNSIRMVREKFPRVHILEQKENVGVAVGNNIGIRYSLSLGTEYTLLLNNDIVVDSNLLEILVKKSDKKRVVVPKIYYYEPDNMLWYAGGSMLYNRGIAVHTGIKQIDGGQYDEERDVEYAPTCCMLIPNKFFDKVGFIDEKMFMYFDDTDLCMRFIENRIDLTYVPSAKMWHKVSSSSGGEDSPIVVYYNTRNRFYFIKKHSKYMKFYVMPYMIISSIVQYIISPIRCKNDKYIKAAMLDYYGGRMGRKDNW